MKETTTALLNNNSFYSQSYSQSLLIKAVFKNNIRKEEKGKNTSVQYISRGVNFRLSQGVNFQLSFLVISRIISFIATYTH